MPFTCPPSTPAPPRPIPEREREREREKGKRSGRASDIHTHRRTIERKQAFCASSLLACTHTQNYARRAGRSAGSDACPLSLNTHDDGGTSPPHVHADMITYASSAVRDPALARIPRRHLYLNDNKLDHLPETIFRNLTSLR